MSNNDTNTARREIKLKDILESIDAMAGAAEIAKKKNDAHAAQIFTTAHDVMASFAAGALELTENGRGGHRMKPKRTIDILVRLKKLHEDNQDLYLLDATNKEIIKALEIGAKAVNLCAGLAHMVVEASDEGDL